MRKIGEMTVKVGSYQKDGQEKGIYKNFGSIMQGDDGRMFGFIDRTFNPAGIPVGEKEKNGQAIFSIFEPQSNNTHQDGGQNYQQHSPSQNKPQYPEDIPF
jgi:hypothetical protein